MARQGLPKWPALIVVGDSVTKEQAQEIIIRTDTLSFWSNDQEFERLLNLHVYGAAAEGCSLHDALMEKHGWDHRQAYHHEHQCRSKVCPVDLNYLSNWQILSSWVGGAHGWCHWDGQISCSNFNIGKWPDEETVHEEWSRIAAAFPFLTLKSQLMSGETCEEGTVPVVEYHVHDGIAEMLDPGAALKPATESPYVCFTTPHWERGCTFGQFVEAFDYVCELMKDRKRSLRT